MDTSTFSAHAALMRTGYLYDENAGVGFFRAASLLEQGGVVHGFTARNGGVSAPPFDTLNLAFNKADPEENVRENFRRFCLAAGVAETSLCLVNFEHGASVVAVTGADCGRGYDREALPPCDGLVTNDPSVTLVTCHADCGAYFFYDPVRRAVGIAHAGWKGTLGRIGKNVVESMARAYGSDPKDIIASTGPCICRDCYEVDEELAERFTAEFGYEGCSAPGRPGKRQLDLEAASAIQFMDAGILPEHITLMHACTFEQPKLLFSHRYARGKTGDMAGFIKLS